LSTFTVVSAGLLSLSILIAVSALAPKTVGRLGVLGEELELRTVRVVENVGVGIWVGSGV
jgi:hypothetical protein